LNSIVVSNTSSSAATKDLCNVGSVQPETYYFNCTSSNFPFGNNITNPPNFVDFNTRDFRLARGSACINRGTNLPWMDPAVDLDGRIRIRDRTVDIGCYEYVFPGMILTAR
jgi:hypothetical protein